MNLDHLDDILMAPNPIAEAKILGDGVSNEMYLAQEAKRGSSDYVMNGSDLDDFETCPHRWINGYKDEGGKSTEWGGLLDCLLTDREHLFDRYIVLPATYTVDKGEDIGKEKPWNWNSNVCKRWWKDHNPGETKTEVKTEVFYSAKDAADLILDDTQLYELFKRSRKQVLITGIYEDKETGVRVPVKALLDLVPPDVNYLCDLKSTKSAHPRAWKRAVFDFGYHSQAARHMDLWNAATGESRNEFKHIVQENFKPFEVAKRFLSSEYLALGRQKYMNALKRYAKALHTGVWETYDVAESANDMLIDGWLMCSPEAWMIG